MKGLATKTVGELILMVVVVIILGAASVAALPYIKDVLAQYFGLTTDNAATEAIECSYLRCTQGCTGKVTSNGIGSPWSKLDPRNGVCPCEGVPPELKENGKICGHNAEQYPVEFKLSAETKLSKSSFLSSVAPDCIAGQTPDWTHLLRVIDYRELGVYCSDNTVSSFTLSANKMYYVDTQKGGTAVGTGVYNTFVQTDRKYVSINAWDDYKREFSTIGVPTNYMIVVNGISGAGTQEGVMTLVGKGCVISSIGSDCLDSIRFRASTAQKAEMYTVNAGEEYGFKFGAGYLVVKVLSTKFPVNLEILYLYTSPCVSATVSCNTYKSKSDCTQQTGCAWIGTGYKQFQLGTDVKNQDNNVAITSMVKDPNGNSISGALVHIIVRNPTETTQVQCRDPSATQCLLPSKRYIDTGCTTASDGKCTIQGTDIPAGNYMIYATVSTTQGDYRPLEAQIPFNIASQTTTTTTTS